MSEDQVPAPVEALPRPDLHALGANQMDQLAGMVLELAAQLHVERVRVRVLEYRLREQGVLPEDSSMTSLPAELAEGLRADLDRALAGLFAPSTERDDARAPLRDEAPSPESGVRTAQGS